MPDIDDLPALPAPVDPNDPVALLLRDSHWYVVVVPDAGRASVLDYDNLDALLAGLREVARTQSASVFCFVGQRLHTTVAPTRLITPRGIFPIVPITESDALDLMGRLSHIEDEDVEIAPA